MTVSDRARRAGEHPVVENGARVGYAASGVLHLLLAWLALRLAWGSYSGEADQSGAFESLTGSTAGVVLLVVLSVGFVLLGLWNLAEAFLVKGETKDRVKHVATGLTYGVLAWGAIEVAAGRDSSGSEQSKDLTARLMANAAGSALVVVIGALFWAAVFTHDPEKASGMDGALRTLLELPLGKALLLLVALGLVAYGIYSFARATYAKV